MLAITANGHWDTLCIRGQHISQKVGPPMDFCHNPLRRGRKWTKSKGFIFFFLKNWSKARRFFFFFTIYYLTCNEMSSLSKLTLEPVWPTVLKVQNGNLSCHKVCFSMLLPIISAAWPSRVRSRPLWWLSLSDWILSKALGTSQGGCHLYFFLKVLSPWLSFIFPLSASTCF